MDAAGDKLLDQAVWESSPCKACGGRTRQHIEVYETYQLHYCFSCRSTTRWDAMGRECEGVVFTHTPEHDQSWRDEFDRKRDADYNPQGQAWNYKGELRQRRVGGRGKTRGHFNFHVTDCYGEE